MKKIFGVLFVAIMLVGCSGGEKTTTVCKGTIDGLEDEYTITAEGDEVTKIVDVGTMDISGTGYSDEKFLALIEAEYSKYDSVKGIEIDSDVKDGIYTGTMSIDMSKADLDKLSELGFVDGEKGVKYISLKATVKEQEKNGLTCKEK